MISRAASLMFLLFSKAVSQSTLTISRAVSLISDDFQGGSISDGLNDFQSWMFIRLIISRARSQYGFRIQVLGTDSSSLSEFVLQLYKLVAEKFLEQCF